MDVNIHPMRPEDTDGKGFVHWKSWQETYTGRMPEAFIARQTLEKCQENARRWPENTLVVRLNGKIVGFSCYGTDDSGAGEVFSIYLLKEAQGLGLGRKLMDATLSRLDRRSPVTLWVLENNDPARCSRRSARMHARTVNASWARRSFCRPGYASRKTGATAIS